MPLAPALAKLLALALADVPALALVLDDWQFADEASVELIGEVLQAPELAALRRGHATRLTPQHIAQPRMAALQQHTALRVVNLQPLSPEGVAEMVASLRLRGANAPALAHALHRRVGGNPLYLLEVLRHMHERRVPMQADQVLAPQHVKALVMARMAELSESARRLLRMAAIAGVDFGPELAEALSGQHVLDLSDAWSALEGLGLFDVRGMAHDLYAEAVLEGLPEPIGRVLHGRVAAWLETRECEAARLAAHWRAAGDDRRAVPHLLAAAHQAWHAALVAEVFDLHRQVAEIEAASGLGDSAFEHWFTNADAMAEMGTPLLLERCLSAMRPLARSAVQHLRVRFVMAMLAWMRNDSEASLVDLSRLIGDAIALGDTRVESECRFAAAHRATRDGRFDEALSQLAAAQRLYRGQGDTRRAAALAATMAMVLGLRGQPRQALAEQARLLPVLRQEGDHVTWTVLCASSALQHARRGDVANAVAAVEDTLAMARRTSIAPPDTAVTRRYLVETLRWAARFEQALLVCEEFTQRLRGDGELPRGQAVPAALYLHLGRADLARPLLQVPLVDLPASARERLRLQLVDLELASHDRVSPPPLWPNDALVVDDLALAAEWVLWSGLQEASPWPIEHLISVAERCERAEMHLLAPAVYALVSRRLLQAGEAAAAAPWLARLTQAQPSGHAAFPWAALFGSQALLAAGRPQEAGERAQAGAAWLLQVAASGMPPPFRDSFLHRHPAHRVLMALAARAKA